MQLILSTVDFLFHAYTDIFLLILFLRDLKIKYRYLFAKDTVIARNFIYFIVQVSFPYTFVLRNHKPCSKKNNSMEILSTLNNISLLIIILLPNFTPVYPAS